MDRKEFLKLSGLAGVASIAGAAGLASKPGDRDAGAVASEHPQGVQECVLIPSETAGPYPLNLSTDATKFRQDIREDQAGVITRVKLKIVSAADCQPIGNARVDIWHCNAFGYYSGYRTDGQNGFIDYRNATWLRGIQMTDSLGEVNFITIFPGWYPGRTVHIHFQIFLSSVLAVTSQLTFPIAEKNALLNAHAPYAEFGSDPQSPTSDMVFSDGYITQIATLTPNDAEGGYDSFLQVVVNGQSTGLRNLEPETGGQFTLGQNYPNPFVSETLVPFTLVRESDVTLEIFDMSGRRITSFQQQALPPGPQTLTVPLASLGMSDASYVYQLTVANSQGEFRQCKVMTRLKQQ